MHLMNGYRGIYIQYTEEKRKSIASPEEYQYI